MHLALKKKIENLVEKRKKITCFLNLKKMFKIKYKDFKQKKYDLKWEKNTENLETNILSMKNIYLNLKEILKIRSKTVNLTKIFLNLKKCWNEGEFEKKRYLKFEKINQKTYIWNFFLIKLKKSKL